MEKMSWRRDSWWSWLSSTVHTETQMQKLWQLQACSQVRETITGLSILVIMIIYCQKMIKNVRRLKFVVTEIIHNIFHPDININTSM